MSSTGRGQRLGGDEDNYPTPTWCVTRLMEKYRPPAAGRRWLEPCAGDGAIMRAVDEAIGSRVWTACEIREECAARLWGSVVIGDFLMVDVVFPADHAVVITNPPFSLAQEVIERSRQVAPLADIVMLARTNFLGSATRGPMFKAVGEPDLYQLPDRPCFVKKVTWKKVAGMWRRQVTTTDSCEFCWLVWPAGVVRSEGRFIRLNQTPPAVLAAARAAAPVVEIRPEGMTNEEWLSRGQKVVVDANPETEVVE